jgi:hypothetical protein
MPALGFIVMPVGVAQLHDLLSCLAKFDENVSLEACTNNVSESLHLPQDKPADLTVSYLKSQHLQNGVFVIYFRREIVFCQI